MYWAVTIPHAIRLNAMLTKKQSCGDMRISPLNAFLMLVRYSTALVPIGTASQTELVPCGTNVKEIRMAPSITKSREEGDETAVRTRIIEAAFAAFTKNGYAATSTLE